jgi:hypothetical protein
MIRTGQRRRLPRPQLFWWCNLETIGSTIGVVMFMVAVMAVCGAFPRGVADFHLAIVLH